MKSTNPPDQYRDCSLDVDSELRVGLGGPWRYCVRNGVVVHLCWPSASLSSSLELAIWVWVEVFGFRSLAGKFGKFVSTLL
uniref:Uncharacterized protein n=1 Tax=Quercus lobata TaxID=97700 RepID=A0A7N2R7H9_QUELO